MCRSGRNTLTPTQACAHDANCKCPQASNKGGKLACTICAGLYSNSHCTYHKEQKAEKPRVELQNWQTRKPELLLFYTHNTYRDPVLMHAGLLC